MSTNGLVVTVVGWAATKPREVTGGVPFTSFRLATTPRYFDSRQGGWADGRTEWLTVKVFRDVALNVAASVNKGDPVVVHGRLRTEEWQGDDGLRTGLVLEAAALGHDLTRGRAVFARTIRAPKADEPVATDAAATPSDGVGSGVGRDAELDPWATEAREAACGSGSGPDSVSAPAEVPVLTP
jgi:single-strand DNA-binding protein